MWRASVLTIFPEMFPGPLGVSLAGKALTSGVWSLESRDIRDAATDKHRTVDDTPAGGGPGMVMLARPLARALGVRPEPGCGLDYHLGGAAGRAAEFRRFKAALDALPLGGAAEEAAVGGAVAAFRMLGEHEIPAIVLDAAE